MRFLIDQTFPHATCQQLIAEGHDAVHVRDRGVADRPDPEVSAIALAESRALVTENVKDFARERGVVVVCVLKSRLPAQGMHVHLAELLDEWARANPEPYIGLHRP
ncbi:MAG: DUF5615 family PIN-like protein [Egibacteraceae bacterium]